MSELDELKKLEIPEFVNFNEAIDVALEDKKKRKKLRRCYLPRGDIVTIVGYRTLESPALFTTKEEGTIDRIKFINKDRVVLTGLKQRAVIRRVHSDLIRDVLGDTYKCVVPDNLCGHCSNCFLFGSLNPDTDIAVKSRLNITTSYSLPDADEAISDEEEFHIMVHSNLSMAATEEERRASIYVNEVIKPCVVFPFVVYMYNPTIFDIVAYIKAHLMADKRGYGNYSAIRGQSKSEFLLITKDLMISPSTLLEKNKEEILKVVDSKKTLVGDQKIKGLAENFDDLASKYKDKLY
jgi:CRISPR type I-D-associated protein Csc2